MQPNPDNHVAEVLAVLERDEHFINACASADRNLFPEQPLMRAHYWDVIDTANRIIAIARDLDTRLATQGGGEDGLIEQIRAVIPSVHLLISDGHYRGAAERIAAVLSATQQQREVEACAVMDGPGGAEFGQCLAQEEQSS